MEFRFDKRNVSFEGFEIAFRGFVLEDSELRYALETLGSFEDPNYTQYEDSDVFISFNGEDDIEALKRLVKVADKLEFARVQVSLLEEASHYFVQNGLELGRSIDDYEDPDDFFYYERGHWGSKKLFSDDFENKFRDSEFYLG